ncbi:hypothetical protein VTI74DRAFT_662 [Chaetomium olivicolor]
MAAPHVTTFDLTDDDVENCWCCHEVIRGEKESRPRYLLEEFGYVICGDCAITLAGSSPPKTVKLYGDEKCPICFEERPLVAGSCGHTLCESCFESIKSPVCPTCRRRSLLRKQPIHVTRCGVVRSLPHQTAPPARSPPGTTGPTNIFRVGELVWYRHIAWRLGVVLYITAKPGTAVARCPTDSDYSFILAPLGLPTIAQANVVGDCQSMRPFLTLTLPPIRSQFKDKAFNTVDWQAVTARCAGVPDIDMRAQILRLINIEACKLGARAINASFSTFGLLSEGATVDGTVRIKSYEGVYLGSEMIRVGDPVRVETTIASQARLSSIAPSLTLVLLVNEIQVIETFQQQPCSTLYFRGDVYRTIRSSLDQPFPPGTVRAGRLGPAFVEELTTLNTIERDRMQWSWVMVESQKFCSEKEVQGRFYVTEKLMRVIEPERYEMWVERGSLDEMSSYLNNRRESGAGRYAERWPGRAATLREAVSGQFRAPDGMTED